MKWHILLWDGKALERIWGKEKILKSIHEVHTKG